MPNKVATTVEVEIFGSTYRVRGEEDSEQLQQLAGLVDRKMREIATQTATVDTTKIAILAALNFAEELRRARDGRNEQRDEIEEIQEIEEKVAGLAGRLETALDG